MPNQLLEVRELSTSFFVRTGVVKAVDRVSFSLQERETLGLVGESGCGKTMTGLSIIRLVPEPGRIVSGEVILGDHNLLALDIEQMQDVRGKRIAMIFQDPMTSLNPVLTIARQITEAMERHLGMNHAEACERGVELLDRVGIVSPEMRINDYPHQFSGGMRQRVMIATALSCNPNLLIADEPTTALDVTIQAQILELMEEMCAEFGTAVILITHNLGVVARICERVAVMYAGQIVESAPTGDIFEHPLHPYTIGLLSSIPRIDEEAGKKLEAIRGLPPSLLNPPARCLFAPRCSFNIDVCWEEPPVLEEIGGGRLVSCWRSREIDGLSGR